METEQPYWFREETKKENRDILVFNENEDTTYQNL